MKLPKHVKISGIKYTVVLKKRLEDSGDACWGLTDYPGATIYIRKELSEQKQRQTLMHEMVHVMMHEAGLDDICNDEKIVTPLGNMLDNVLASNNLAKLY
ncbi:ImmA/IrrE family metallo-endopeptidase [Lactiplantibacillus paraplantarum]|uniref:ImmA/IrrE family metallo-endopeptidase n=1 Tax=Lactiplantibacillus paraplantarum TaxID=60520 RepID=UPI0023AB10A4|nr:ImmA/IrrE family metallo-endopeptidase [Lactiplantibacillus paraplantarum]WEE35068.1 ImmA/IrrE family metallo-endopeptidase [Lactiplantibacillus paraplantarum]